MDDELELDAVMDSIKSAFAPLRCGVELFDYKYRLRIRVFDANDKPILNMKEALVSTLRNRQNLVGLVNEWRARVQEKGHSLQPWQPPK